MDAVERDDSEMERLKKYTPQFLEMCKNSKILFDYDSSTDRIKITLPWAVERLSFSAQLGYTIGYDAPALRVDSTAKYSPELRGGLNHLYVYAPGLVENTELGGETAPLLRIVNVKGLPGQWVEEVFLDDQYKRLIARDISQISIELRSSAGRLIPFNWGECILCLNFRQIRVL